jgi:L-fuconolactonase
MRVDAHQHFWMYDRVDYDWISDDMSVLQRDFLPADLAPLLASRGFDGCIAVQARQSLRETEWLLDLADAHPFILGVVGWVDLCSPHVGDQLDAFATRRKLVGIRHIVQAEPDDDFLLRADFCRGIALLDARHLAYDILVYPKHLNVAERFARRFPNQRFVLDHLAKPPIAAGELEPWARDVRALAALDHVSCKLSGMVTEADWRTWTPAQIEPYLDTAMEAFGPARVMMGSDWPVCTLAADYGTTVDLVLDYVGRLTENERSLVLGDNAQRFWRLDTP